MGSESHSALVEKDKSHHGTLKFGQFGCEWGEKKISLDFFYEILNSINPYSRHGNKRQLVQINTWLRRTFSRTVAVLGRRADLYGTGAVVGLNVWAEEGREADEGGEEGSRSSSMGLGGSPPLWTEKKRGC